MAGNKNEKGNKGKPRISTTAVVVIVIGVLVALFMTFTFISSQNEINDKNEQNTNYEQNEQYGKAVTSCLPSYTLCGGSCLKCDNGYYLGNDCQCYPTKETQSDLDYEKADARWQQYTKTLKSDEERINDIIDDYCNGISTGNEIEQCVNLISPILSSYTTHITNAQTFMQANANVFGNDIELLAYLDDKAVYAQTLANNINSMVNNYNSQQTSSEYEIDDETIGAILKILAIAI